MYKTINDILKNIAPTFSRTLIPEDDSGLAVVGFQSETMSSNFVDCNVK